MEKTIPYILLGFLFIQCQTMNNTYSHQSNGCIVPELKTGHSAIDKAFRVAIGDYFTNIQSYNISVSDTSAPVILAGLDYDRPWTRDASINCWNAGSLLTPEIARNTLLSVLTRNNGNLRIGGQYWDAIIWVTGAWHHYMATGDDEFLETSYVAAVNSLHHYEKMEFNKDYNLFRGLGWSDGVAAYEGKYAHTGGSAAAFHWPQHNPGKVSPTGHGIPMMAVSTNCLYYNAYRLTGKMAEALNKDTGEWAEKASRLKQAINKHLWNESTGVYKFYIDEVTESNLQETLGNAYAILFGVAEKYQTELILKNQHVAPAGVPCGWPPLERYTKDSSHFARHNGVVWPHIQGFWAHAVSKHNRPDMLYHELNNLANHAIRDMQFAEIYHPVTGEQYGGLQERDGEIVLWEATNRQTWAATGYLRMMLYGVFGLNKKKDHINFSPCVPKELGSHIQLSNLQYRNMELNISVQGYGTAIKKVYHNGTLKDQAVIPANLTGRQDIAIYMGSR